MSIITSDNGRAYELEEISDTYCRISGTSSMAEISITRDIDGLWIAASVGSNRGHNLDRGGYEPGAQSTPEAAALWLLNGGL